MAADLYILVKNDFREVNDLVQAKMYVEHTITRIEEQLGKGVVTNLVCHNDEDMVFVEFEIGEETDDWVWLTLKNGYWIIYTAIHHKHLVDDHNGRFMLCETAHQYARLLGANEVWYTSDMSMEQFDDTISLDDFIAEKQNQGNYAEFNPEELLKLPRHERPLFGVYHDKFE